MIVFIEDCLIENFIVTFLIVCCISKIYRQQINKLRLVLSCIFASVISVCYPLFNLNGIILIIFKMAVACIIICIAFKKGKFLANYISFLLLTALYAGFNLLIYYLIYGTLNVQDNFPTYILLLMLSLIYFLTNMCFKLLKKNLAISNFVYKIQIKDGESCLIDNAFLDSGNTLLDIDTSPIFIINFKLFNKLYKNITIQDILLKNYSSLKDVHYVKSCYASGSSKLLVFKVDKLTILTNHNQIEFVNANLGLVHSKFDKNFNCNMLLNINAFCK